MADFASMLKYLRERESLSQRELASKLGLSPSAIGMYESGKRRPKYEDEEAIADFFNVDLNTLRGKRIDESLDYERVATAMKLYNAYTNASPDVRQAVEILLKTAQSIPKVEPQEDKKPVLEIPHLKKDTRQ